MMHLYVLTRPFSMAPSILEESKAATSATGKCGSPNMETSRILLMRLTSIQFYTGKILAGHPGKFDGGATLRVIQNVDGAIPSGVTNMTNGVRQWHITSDIIPENANVLSRTSRKVMRNKADFIKAISKTILHPEPGYGGNVLPAARIYSEITSEAEARSYQSALEELLKSDDDEVRNFAINLCLGFFSFYDAIPRPKFEAARHGNRED